MAAVSVEVNGRVYVVGCEDGQEAHVQALARSFDAQVRDVARDVGQLGEARLFLMGGLLVADELADVRARLAQAQAELARLQSDHARAVARGEPPADGKPAGHDDEAAAQAAETRAAQALDAAARRVETLADALAADGLAADGEKTA